MADVAAPQVSATFDTSAEKKKPERPDEDLFKANLKKVEKEHADAKAKFDAARAKLDVAQPNKSKDSPVAKKRQALLNQLTEIRQKQAGGKAGRNQTVDQIKKLDEQLKSRIAENKAARSRVSFKSVDEIDSEIDRLERQVNGGMMKLVDERKALAEISNLRKLRKGFAGFDDAQKGIDETKAKIKSLKDSLEDPEAKALSAKYDEIQGELNIIKAEQDEAYKGITTLREEREKAYAELQEKFLAMKKVSDDYYHQKKAFQNYEYEARQRARERQKAERENYEREKRKERAERMLAEARDPAYLDEIRRAESLLHYLDPSSTIATAPLVAPSGLSALPQRTVDASDIKGTRVVRKDERDDSYFMGTGGKKAKKGRRNAAESPAAASSSGKFLLPTSVMEDCSAMGIDPPMSASDIPAVANKVKEKLAFWKADQKVQTDKNIAKAQKEIERLEAEGVESSPATPTTNGHSSKETATDGEIVAAIGDTVSAEDETVKNAASNVAAELEDASIEEKK